VATEVSRTPAEVGGYSAPMEKKLYTSLAEDEPQVCRGPRRSA